MKEDMENIISNFNGMELNDDSEVDDLALEFSSFNVETKWDRKLRIQGEKAFKNRNEKKKIDPEQRNLNREIEKRERIYKKNERRRVPRVVRSRPFGGN